MSGFSKDWLQLREPFDQAARSKALMQKLSAWAGTRQRLNIVDLGAGIGANLRALEDSLPPYQDWRLLDHDPALIEAAAINLAQQKASWRYQQVDLAADLEAALTGEIDLITATAFLDLVSASWIDRLLECRRRLGAALYFTLTFDGKLRWRPGDIYDRPMVDLFHRHQRGDKGFGPALGPDAHDYLMEKLLQEPGDLISASSDWNIDRGGYDLQELVLLGWHQSALEMSTDPVIIGEINDWREERLGCLNRQRSSLIIGHKDLLFLPV